MIKHGFLLGLLFSIVVSTPTHCAERRFSACYMPTEVDENSPNTLIGYDKTNVRPFRLTPASEGSFGISFGRNDGICRLRTQFPFDGPTRQEIGPGVQEFDQSVSFNTPDGLQKLSLASASKIFGEPRKHGTDSIFYTFDADTNDTYEKQTYHIDMRFGKDGFIESYRIRGIGIDKPQWISK